MPVRHRGIEAWLKWIRKAYKGTKFQKNVATAIVAALVYQIWVTRNKALWDKTTMSIDHSVQQVKYNVKNRVTQILSDKISVSNRTWLTSL